MVWLAIAAAANRKHVAPAPATVGFAFQPSKRYAKLNTYTFDRLLETFKLVRVSCSARNSMSTAASRPSEASEGIHGCGIHGCGIRRSLARRECAHLK